MASKAARRKQRAVQQQQEADHGEGGTNSVGAVQKDEGQERRGVTPRQKRASRKLPAKKPTRKTAVKKRAAPKRKTAAKKKVARR